MIENGMTVGIDKGAISIVDISFKYEEITVLDSVSMCFESGKKYAIVGQSGAGKTTVLNLLLGLIKVKGGAIIIDDYRLSEMNLLSYYKYVAYLSQSPAVFDGTVRENLVFDEEVSEDRLWEALKKVNMHSRINNMENKLDENIGEKGSVLSGGEKQRLALARVILSQPKILILDEPTSAIDTINESIIMKNVLGELASTVIAVTHRVRTTHMFDEVILLDEGKVQDVGSTEDLLKRSNLFQKLYMKDEQDSKMEDA